MYKIIKYLLILISFTLCAFQSAKLNQLSPLLKSAKSDSLIVKTPDKTILQSDPQKEIQKVDWGKNMPWIGAIIIGLTTLCVNLFISYQTRRSSVEIAKLQMNLAKENNERDFKKTVLSSSRQLWITDFRNTISELLSLSFVICIEKNLESTNRHKLQLLVTKAELLLSGDANYSELSKLLTDLKVCCIGVIAENQSIDDLENIITDIKEMSSSVINMEWDKASKAE
jgi:hypothetical protein